MAAQSSYIEVTMAKYVYIDELGQVINSVKTGEGEDTIPEQAIAWPDDLDFDEAVNYGYDLSKGEFVPSPTDRPSNYHFFNYSTRQWGYKQELAEKVEREMRDAKLSRMDWVLCNPLRWASFSPEKQAEWAAYRQALLDVPQQPGFPLSIEWPVPPN